MLFLLGLILLGLINSISFNTDRTIFSKIRWSILNIFQSWMAAKLQKSKIGKWLVKSMRTRASPTRKETWHGSQHRETVIVLLITRFEIKTECLRYIYFRSPVKREFSERKKILHLRWWKITILARFFQIIWDTCKILQDNALLLQNLARSCKILAKNVLLVKIFPE